MERNEWLDLCRGHGREKFGMSQMWTCEEESWMDL